MNVLRRRLALICALGLSVAVCGAVAFVDPAQANETRSGQFELYRHGTRVGSESWKWAEDASGSIVVTGQCAVDIDGIATTIHPSLTFQAASLTPVAYEFERAQGDLVRRVSTTFNGGRAVQQIEENGMSSKRQLKIKPSDLVINDEVLHQFLLLAERYDFEKGGTQDFTVFDVKLDRSYVAHAMVRGLGTVENGMGKFRVRRLTLVLQDLSVDLYVDSQGRVPQISIPMRGIEAKAPGYRGDEKVESPGSSPPPTLGVRLGGS